MSSLFSLLKGFSTSGSLIIAIGAQNAFVIRQGLSRRHLLLTAFLCSLIDSLLIVSGVVGMGHLITSYPLFIDLMKYFALIFLFSYGAISFKSAFQKNRLNCSKDDNSLTSTKKTVFSLLALSLLNPHVYLDTVVLLGSIGSQQPSQDQIFFTLGAIGASFMWFFGITYGASFLAPIFQQENAWKVMDFIVAFMMWSIALSLLI